MFDPQNSQLEGKVTRVNFTELSEASNNFNPDNAIGPGKIGVMYKAMLVHFLQSRGYMIFNHLRNNS